MPYEVTFGVISYVVENEEAAEILRRASNLLHEGNYDEAIRLRKRAAQIEDSKLKKRNEY